MRKANVEILLDHARQSIASIKKVYEGCLRTKSIPDSLLVDVKNAMENLRSCLDYIAHDVADVVVNPDRKSKGKREIERLYFPYGENKQEYEASVKRNLPDVDTLHPAVSSIIEAVQPHSCGSPWLCDFCETLNANKHNDLSPQERQEQQTYKVGVPGGGATISAPAGAIKAPPGAIRIGGAPVVFDPQTGLPFQTPGLKVSVTTWVSFVFEGTSIKVLPLLEKAFEEIGETAKKLYAVL